MNKRVGRIIKLSLALIFAGSIFSYGFAKSNDASDVAVSYKYDSVTLLKDPVTTLSSLTNDNLVSASQEEEGEYELLWEDDFSENDLDLDVWGYELGSVRGNEQQHYVDSEENVFLRDGNLVLKVTDRAVEDQYMNPRGGANARKVIYNSGSVRTHAKKEFLYGRIEMKAKLPKGKGAFPAFWTLGADFLLDGDINSEQGYGWPSCGEIDIMEIIGAPTAERAAQGEIKEGAQSNSKVYATPHFYWKGATGDPDRDGSYSPFELGKNYDIGEDLNNEYHIFGINWTPEKIEWYIDDVIYNTMEFKDDNGRMSAAAASLNRPQYIQFNLATGGNWAKNAGLHLGEDNTEFTIDWVRWMQDDEQKAAAEAYYQDNPVITGVKDITMIEGTTPDLLKGISVNKIDYSIDYSIEDEYMFSNTGGLTNSTLRCSGVNDIEKLAELEPGLYNIFYTAAPLGETLSGPVTPTPKVKRESSILVVLPKELDGETITNLTGLKGANLSTVTLPDNFNWVDGDQKIDGNTYSVKYTKVNKENDVREIYSDIKIEVIDKSKLLNVLEQSEELLTKTDQYSKESLDNLSEKVEIAQTLLSKKNITENDLTRVRMDVKVAIMDLEEK